MNTEETMLKFEKSLNFEYYTLKKFDFISGETLRDLVVEHPLFYFSVMIIHILHNFLH
ncbi:MAG: hypothetical protein LBC39_00130 [Methanobrevibacter sp.]|nr:hypothetical protein [Candidatus Methanovirga aequatorialis]